MVTAKPSSPSASERMRHSAASSSTSSSFWIIWFGPRLTHGLRYHDERSRHKPPAEGEGGPDGDSNDDNSRHARALGSHGPPRRAAPCARSLRLRGVHAADEPRRRAG